MPPPGVKKSRDELLSLSEPVLRQLFDHVEGVQCWIKDLRGVYRWVNRAFLLNYSLDGEAECVVGRTDYDLSPRHLAEQFQLDDQRVVEGETIVDRLELVGRFDHVSAWCRTTKLPIRDGHGRVEGTAGITRVDPLTAHPEYTDMGLTRIFAYVREHHSDPIGSADMARVGNRSVRSMERAFSRELRMSPQQYLRRVRVRLSCHDLVYGAWSLSEVALRHGFCDQSHFTREFRRETGMTPGAYRQHFRSGKTALEEPTEAL
jgi:AraC-like DNA-binding protein